MKTTEESARVQKSRGSVFADLGVRNPQGMLAKARLARRICEAIADGRLRSLRNSAQKNGPQDGSAILWPVVLDYAALNQAI